MVNAAQPAALTPMRWNGPVKVIRDTWLVFERQMLLLFRLPVRIVFTFVYPVTYLLIYAPMLRGALTSEGVTNYTEAYRVYVPGLLAFTATLGGLSTGFILLADIRSGVLERTRVLPVSRTSILLGRALREVASLLLQGVIITILALPSGLRVGIGDLLLSYLLMALIALLTVSFSYALTIRIHNASTLGPLLGVAAQPVMLISGMLLPLTLAPLWMVAIAKVNPFYWATNGMRDLFAGDLAATSVWVSFVLVLTLTVLTMNWSLRLFTRDLR